MPVMHTKNIAIKRLRLGLLSCGSAVPLSKSRLSRSIIYASSAIACMQTVAFAGSPAPGVISAPANTGQAFVVNEPISPNDPNNPIPVPFHITGSTPVVTTGVNTYVGPTVVGANQNAATTGMYYNMGQTGTANQTFTINPAGVYLGSGTTLGNVTNNGTISPGNNSTTTFTNEPALPVGTRMNINGSFTQTSTGMTRLYLTPTTCDQVAVTGAVDFANGQIQITPLPGFYDPNNPTTFTVISWGAHTTVTPNIVVTTENLSGSSQLELTVTPQVTSTGLVISVTGADRTLTSGTTDVSTLSNATGTVNMPNNATLASSANTSQTIIQPITLTGSSAAITSAAGSTLNLSGQITGTSALNVSGSGITVFGAANIGLAGPVNVASSTVQVSNSADLGSGALNLSGAGATVNLGATSGDTVTLRNTISLTDTTNPVTLVVPAGASATLSRPITGATGTTLNMSGGGTTTISSANPSFAGNVNVSDSTISLASGANLGTGTVALTGAMVNLAGGASLNNAVTTDAQTTIALQSTANTTATVAGSISGAGTISMSGGGTSLFTGANTGLTGPVNVAGSTVQVAANSSLGSGAVNLSSSGAAVNFAAGANINNASITTVSGTTIGLQPVLNTPITVNSALSGAGVINVGGGGSATFSASNTSLTGAVNVSGSTVQVSNGANLGSGALNLSGAGATINLGSASGNAVTLLNPVSLTDTANPVTMVVPAGASATLSEPITGVAGTTLNMSGGGATTISSANPSFAGNMSVSNSTVSLASGADLGTGNIALTGATVNIVGGSRLNNAVTTDAETTIALQPTTNTTATFGGSLSGAGTVNVSGGGTVQFSATNTALTGPVNVTGSTVQIANNANLGAGTLNVSSGTISMGAVALPNPVSVTAASTFTSNATSGATSTLSGPITGSAPITFNGTGKTNLTATGTSAYSGNLTASTGYLAINCTMPSASVNVTSGAVLSGAGTIGSLVQGGSIKPGNSIGDLTIGSYATDDGAIYNVEISPTESSRILVTGDATLNSTYNINVLMDAGIYSAGTVDYAILKAGGTLTTNAINVQWNTQAGLTFTVGTLAGSGTSADGKDLVLRYTSTQPFTINADQTTIDTTTLGTTYNLASFGSDSAITIGGNDVVATNSGLVVPVAEQVELTSQVFQNTQSATLDNDVSNTATADAFRFKAFKPTAKMAPTGTSKGAVEALLTAISQNGPVSYEKNETRLWISPYVNRSRTSLTNSNPGNQGWSGGSLIGIEQRDQKNIWSVGLLGGLNGSRSHVLGTPSSFSKTTGFLFGGYNTYKYTDYKDSGNFGHELLASHTITSVDSQRYGLPVVGNTPYNALASYKTTTDILNAQLNYLFDVIKKSVSCRLNAGVTYQGTQSGKITERNAGVNNLTTAASTSKQVEYYSGIGIRKIWTHENITVRLTGVYEYGYQATSTSTGGASTRTGGTVAIGSTTQSVAPTTFAASVGPRQNKHYFQLNGSYLDRSTGLKFITSYSGVLYKNVQNHTAMVKVEYRF